MFQDKNQVVAPSITPKVRGGGRTQNLRFILKILRISNLNSKMNLKRTVEFRIFNHFTVVGVVHTVVSVVVSVLGTLTNTFSAGTGSNPTIGIQSSIVAVNFYGTLSVR
jgi:hypothetical protein